MPGFFYTSLSEYLFQYFAPTELEGIIRPPG
jgi:hypothetical protein